MPSETKWNVWIEGDPEKKEYSKGREEINNLCGQSCGSGSGDGGWDVSYHGLEKEKAEEITKRAASLDFTRSVCFYSDEGRPSKVYLKGSE